MTIRRSVRPLLAADPRMLAFALVALLLGPIACDGPRGGVPVGSNTNWLKACDETADCGADGACVCNTCSLECRADADCSRVPHARCAAVAETAVRSQCASAQPSPAYGMCLAGCEPGGCGSRGACVGGACVGRAWPDAALCAESSEPDDAALARQDRLLGLVEGMRVAGGVECGGAAASLPVAELRWDPRLACAARALATDMASTRALSLVDSAGRDTKARLMLVGYSARVWGESFALTPGDEASALAAMLSDLDSCSRFVDAAFADIGVGVLADAYVITTGAE